MTDDNAKSTGGSFEGFYLATVREINSSGIKIQLDGEDQPMSKRYKRLTTVRLGNRVLAVKLNGTFIILGPLT